MIFLHTGDLHLGKTVNDFTMIEDQKFILEQIKGMALKNKADVVILSGDIYDRAIPSADAVSLLDSFLTDLSRERIQVLMISGNHDSPERISFLEEIMAFQGIGIAGVLKEELTSVRIIKDNIQTVFVLLPFTKPGQTRSGSTGEGVKKLLCRFWEQEKNKNQKTHEKRAYVLAAHYFVTDHGKEPELSDSETTFYVGGLDHVEASLFKGFDYVALGHIHKPQQVGKGPVYYAGSPLAYSFGETDQVKSVILGAIEEKGDAAACTVKRLALNPLHKMRRIKGRLKDLLSEAMEEGEEERKDYIQAVLTDQGEMIDAIGTLRSVYPNIMQVVMEHKITASMKESKTSMMRRKKTDLLFSEFYEEVREEPLSEEGKSLITSLVKELEG